MKEVNEIPDFDLVRIRKQSGFAAGWDAADLLKYLGILVALIVGIDIGLWGGFAIDHGIAKRDAVKRTDLIALVKAGVNPLDAACAIEVIDPESNVCSAIRSVAK